MVPETRIVRTLTDTCILIWHVINANTFAQHVRFEELPSGFDSGSRGMVVFLSSRAGIKKVRRIHKCDVMGNRNYKKGTITAKLRLGDNPLRRNRSRHKNDDFR